jgi:hypothetical protein
MNKLRLEVYEFREAEFGLLSLSASMLLMNETNPASRDAKPRINHCRMDTNEEVQDRYSGRLSKCGA